MSELCEHGFEKGKSRLPEGAYAAPIGKCRCCGTLFVYIGSGSAAWGESGTVSAYESVVPDPNLCPECGGRPMILRMEDDRVLEYNPGSHGPPTAAEAQNYTPPAPDLQVD